MTVPFVLLILGALAAATAPRLLSRADWPEREPVLALWVWQCVIAAVLLCCVSAMALLASAAWWQVRGHVFAFAPAGVVDAYGLSSSYGRWAGTLAILLALGGLWTAATLTREVRATRARRRLRRAELRERAPRLPGETVPATERLVVLEDTRTDAWWLSGADQRLVITTAALNRLKGRQLDAVLEHEQGHVRARHDLLLHSAGALAGAFPQVPVFAAFRDQVHQLVELAADDTASRRVGRLTTALALVELNEERGVFGPGAAATATLPGRVHRLLEPAPRLSPARRLRVTVCSLLIPAVPLLIAFGPGIGALT